MKKEKKLKDFFKLTKAKIIIIILMFVISSYFYFSVVPSEIDIQSFNNPQTLLFWFLEWPLFFIAFLIKIFDIPILSSDNVKLTFLMTVIIFEIAYWYVFSCLILFLLNKIKK